ncbi:hypothetical protein ONZ45_g11040 [Pleurotus djamor]|nr:hypothetical protein ONZ45_g11040 [Pleurotus djamor]
MAVNDMPDLSYIRWEHQLVVRDVVRDPDTIVLIAKAIRLQDHIYVHISGDQVEKVQDASDAQLYCAFFAFADYLGGIKPRETYRWFDSILPSLGAAGANATGHLPKHGELSPEELFSLQIGKGVCMLCAQAKMMGIPQCINMYMYTANLFVVAMVIIGAVASPNSQTPNPSMMNQTSPVQHSAPWLEGAIDRSERWYSPPTGYVRV